MGAGKQAPTGSPTVAFGRCRCAKRCSALRGVRAQLCRRASVQARRQRAGAHSLKLTSTHAGDVVWTSTTIS